MEYGKILSRAWHITFSTRPLWIFGFLLAFFGGGQSGGGNGNFNFNFSGFNPTFVDLIDVNADLAGILLITGVSLVLGWILMGIVIRPVSTAAMINLEQQMGEGETASLKMGWKLGWTRQALYIFLIDLIIGISTTVVLLVTLCAALTPLLLLYFDNNLAWILGGGATASFCCLWIAFSAIFGLLISPFVEISRRYVVLGNMSPLRSIDSAYKLLRHKIKDLIAPILLMFAFNFAWNFIQSIVLMVGGIGSLGIGSFTIMVTDGSLDVLTSAILLFIAIALVIGGLLWLFIKGLFLAFQLVFWSITFKEVNLIYY